MRLLKGRIITRFNRLRDALGELEWELIKQKFPNNTPVVLSLWTICDMLEDFWDLFDKSLPEREKASTFFLEPELDLEDE